VHSPDGVQHVYRQIQTLVLPLLPITFTYNGPAKSTPVEVNEESILTRKSGSGGGSGSSLKSLAHKALAENLFH